MADWTEKIFGKDDKFITDFNSAEAYVVEDDGINKIMKLPFVHQRLKHGLKRVLGSKNDTPWTRYLIIAPHHRGIVDEVTKFAKEQTANVRTCLAFEEHKKEGQPAHFIIFFSLGTPPPPVFFTDAVGRNFQFPYEMCRTWPVSIYLSPFTRAWIEKKC
jgi:hypothetical protein